MTVTVVERPIDQVISAKQKQEASTHPPVPVDRLIQSLGSTQQAAVSQSLAPLGSHTWLSAENHRHVMKWCAAAALVAARSGEQSTGALEGMPFLIAAMVDCYHNDRALYAATNLPGNPAPQRISDIPQQIQRSDGVYSRRDNALVWSANIPMEAVDRVADILADARPDRFLVATYLQTPVVHYDPIIFALYGNWVVKVAEWE